jgi:hypothetical protein
MIPNDATIDGRSGADCANGIRNLLLDHTSGRMARKDAEFLQFREFLRKCEKSSMIDLRRASYM